MNSSGIKRGLAVSAVAALGVVGIPGIAHAASYSSLSLTAGASSVVAWQYDNLSATALGSDGKAATSGAPTAVDITVTEANPKGATDTSASPFQTDLTTGTVTAGDAASGQWTLTATNVTAADAAAFKLGSSVAGTVNVKVVDHSNTAISKTTTFTVSGGTNGAPADVKSLSLSATSLSEYVDDWTADKGSPFTVSELDSSSKPVAGPTVNYTVTKSGTTGTAGSGTIPVPAITDFSDSNQFVKPAANLNGISGEGTYTVTLWVDNSDNGTTGLDAGEPSATFTLTLTKTPENAAVTDVQTPTVTDVNGQLQIPADATTYSLPTTLTVVDDKNNTDASDDTPLANAKVRFDVVIHPADGSADVPMSVPAVTDANGVASITPSLPAGYDVDGTTIDVTAFLSSSSTAGAGTTILPTQTIHVKNRQLTIAFAGTGDHVQASKGSTVSVPVVLADQFGDAPKATQQLGFTVQGSNTTNGAQSVLSTDASGKATFTYAEKAGVTNVTATPYEDQVIVKDLTNPAPAVADKQINVDVIAGSTAPAKVTLTADPTSTATSPDAASLGNKPVGPGANNGPYTVQVVNSDNEPLVNSPVTFKVDNGFVVDAGKPTNKGASITVYTGNDGTASVNLGSKTAGSQSLSVAAGSATVAPKYSISYVAGSAYSITWSSAPSTIVPGDEAKFLVKVTDKWGNPVSGVTVDPSTGSNSEPGQIDWVATFNTSTDKDGIVPVYVKTVAGDSGTGSLTVKPGWTATKATDADEATAPYTDANGITTTYTVEEPEVVTPQPPKAPVIKVKAAGAKSVGKNDVVTIKLANANGKVAKLVKAGKVIKKATVRHGKVTFKVKDTNGKKVTRYVVRIGHKHPAVKTK